MADRRIEHNFDCSVNTFWSEVFLNQDYNQALFRERLRFERWEVVSQTETATGLARVVEAVPRVGEMPGPLRAILKNGVGYTEHGEFNRAESLYTLKAVSHSLPDKLMLTGEMRVTADGEGRCRRVHMAHAKAKVFGVGGLLEGRVLDGVEKSYNRAAEFTHDWLRERDLVGK